LGTPVCALEYLNLVEVRDNGSVLTIIVESGTFEQRSRFQFAWPKYCAYRSTDEAQFIAWDLDLNDSNWQHTHLVRDSLWIADLMEGNDLLEFHYPGIQHFVICTMDYVTEILSHVNPEITSLKPDLEQ